MGDWQLSQFGTGVAPIISRRRSPSEIAAVTSANPVDSPPRSGLVIFDDLDVHWLRYAYGMKEYILKSQELERVSVLYLLDMNAFPAHAFDRETYYISRSIEVEYAVLLLMKSAHLRPEDSTAEDKEIAYDIAKVRTGARAVFVG